MLDVLEARSPSQRRLERTQKQEKGICEKEIHFAVGVEENSENQDMSHCLGRKQKMEKLHQVEVTIFRAKS